MTNVSELDIQIPKEQQHAQTEGEAFGADFCLSLIRSHNEKTKGYEFEDFERDLRDGPGQESAMLASALIDRGYPRPVELYKSLAKSEAKEKLYYKLLDQGHIALSSPIASEAQEYVADEVERREDLRDLIFSGMPIEVIGQIMTIDHFGNLTDEQKLEERRSWMTLSLLRPYLGTLEGERRTEEEFSIPDIVKRIPKQVFTNQYAAKYNLVENYFTSQFMKMITKHGLDKGFAMIDDMILASVDDEDKLGFFSLILDELHDIASFTPPQSLNTEIIVKDDLKSFPSFEQRAFAYYATNQQGRLLTAETGLGKTGAAFLAMEQSDAQRVLVIAPAAGMQTWKEQDAILFKNPGDIFIVEGTKDLQDPAIHTKKYVVISQSLLGRTHLYDGLAASLDALLHPEDSTVLPIDGVIIDEIDNLIDPKSKVTKTTAHILDTVRGNYQRKTGKKTSDAPVIGLTATPIRTDLEDLNVPMSFLYPDEFVMTEKQAEEDADRKTFHGTCLKNPWLAYPKLIGERRMFRWVGETEKVYQPEIVSVSPFEQLLYDFAEHEFKTDAFTRVRLLEDVLLNPTLARPAIRERMMREGTFAFHEDTDIYADELLHIVQTWKEKRGITAPSSDEDYLSVDTLVELGFHKFVLEAYFHPLFDERSQGIDFLVEDYSRHEKYAELAQFWKPRELSSKYTRLRDMLSEALTLRTLPDGSKARKKVMIVSPNKRQGRTGEVEQKQVEGENGSHNLISDKELELINDMTLPKLVAEWLPRDMTSENILVIDGVVAPKGKKRDGVIQRWVHNPHDVVLLATLESIFQSRDFTISKTEDADGNTIDGVQVIFLTWPWHWQQLSQTMGRNIRLGMILPVDNKILESKDLLCAGKGEGVTYTKELSSLTLSGVTTSPEMFDKRKRAMRIPLRSKESKFLGDAMGYLRGSGEDEASKFNDGKSHIDGKNRGEYFGDHYYDNGKDEQNISGFNAEFVSNMIQALGLQDASIASIGAGTLLLQRKLQRGIDNVDINPYMMQAGWEKASAFGGRRIVGRASALDQDVLVSNTYDVVDNAFSLHWSKLKDKKHVTTDISSSERVKILKEMHRILKPGGMLSVTLPEHAFEEEKFTHFLSVLEKHFGFSIQDRFTGKTFGRNDYGMRKRLGWSIAATKTGDIDLEGLELEDLAFYYDRDTWVSKVKNGSHDQSPASTIVYPKPDTLLTFDAYEVQSVGSHRSEIITKVKPEQKVVTNESPSRNVPVETEPTQSFIEEHDVFESASLPLPNVATLPGELPILYGAAFLRGDPHKIEDRRVYVDFRKYVLRELDSRYNISFEDGEDVAVNALHEWIRNKGQLPRSRQDAYKFILKVVRQKAETGMLDTLYPQIDSDL